jgi:Ankyrin repeats (3 copies)
LEHVATQRMFVIRLDTLPSPPAVSVNATLELQYLDMMVAIECIQKVEEKGAREREELRQKMEEKSAGLGQMKRELEVVKDVLRKLRVKESFLVDGLEDGAQEVSQLNARHEQIRQQQESMSARRLDMQPRLIELRDSKSIAGGNSEQSMAVDDRTLHWAAQNGHGAVVQMLLDRGADMEAKEGHDRTPLHVAAQNGHGAVVQMLLNKGADVAAKEQGGGTPLHGATLNGHGAVVQMLLDWGADVEAKERHNRTPLSQATENGHDAVV